ncbi:MAG: hypothetical protein N4A40_11785 [Tissierellales bacterium]|nr:hypothetical protein [Tissierellales bacterium]
MKNIKKSWIIIIAILLFILIPFIPKSASTLLEKTDSISDIYYLSVSCEEFDYDNGYQIVYEVKTEDKEKIDKLYDYLSKISVRKAFYLFKPNDIIRANKTYLFTGSMNFTIISDKYICPLGNHGTYINTDGFDMEKIKSILDEYI